MMSKLSIAAMVPVTMGLASPAFAQVPPGYYYDYAGPYAYAYEQPVPYGWAPYGYWAWRSWYPNIPASISNNIHTPFNH
jgi:hypothetical protein